MLTYCGYKRRIERILRESKQYAGFANSRVADKQQFEQVVVRFGHFNLLLFV